MPPKRRQVRVTKRTMYQGKKVGSRSKAFQKMVIKPKRRKR